LIKIGFINHYRLELLSSNWLLAVGLTLKEKYVVDTDVLYRNNTGKQTFQYIKCMHAKWRKNTGVEPPISREQGG
jgi:hypothetical protein